MKMLAAIKNYRLEVGGKDIRAVNTWSMLLLSMGIILFFLVPGDVVSGDDPERGPSRWVLTLGIFTFAVALATVGREKLRYQLSVWGLVLMVIRGAWDTYNSFVLPGQITYGLEISYFLLPLTVLAFFLGKWSVHGGFNLAVEPCAVASFPTSCGQSHCGSNPAHARGSLSVAFAIAAILVRP